MRVLKSVVLLGAILVLLTLTPTAPSVNTDPSTGAVSAAGAAPRVAAAGSHGLAYVAMGSSFAAGPGIPPAEAGGAPKCARSAGDYANLVAADLGAALTDVSCSGATTADILYHSQNGQPPQIKAVGPRTRLVTVTIGGNDIGYFDSLAAYSCQDGGGGGGPCHAVDTGAIRRALPTLMGRLENVVTAIRARAPRVRVLLVNYFTILPGSGTACAGVPLSAPHLAFERALAADLARDTAAAAHATGATLVDLAAASARHDACSARPWVNTFTPAPGSWPYHPDAAGMAGAARLIEQTLARESSGSSSPARKSGGRGQPAALVSATVRPGGKPGTAVT